MTATTPEGTTVTLHERGVDTLVLLARPDRKTIPVGRISQNGGFQPTVEPTYALRPSTLRAIADLIDAQEAPSA